MKAYLDRIEDGKFAVIILENEAKEFILPVSDLPEGTKQGDYFDVELTKEKIISMAFDELYTNEKRTQISAKLTQLRLKSTGSKYKKRPE